MEKKIHIEIDYTVPDTSKFCEPIIDIEIENEDPKYVKGILNSVLLHLVKDEIYEDEKTKFKEQIKKEVIKEYLQSLMEVVK